MSAEHGVCAQTLSERLFEAIQNNNIYDVRMCIEQGVNLESHSVFYPTSADLDFDVYPLGHACCLGHEEIMVLLLEAGADPNQDPGTGYSGVAMKWAAVEHKITLSMIETLISYGADVNLLADNGETVLHYLARGEDYNTSMTGEELLTAVTVLLDNGASCFDLGEDDITPLHHACRSGNFDLIKLLIEESWDSGDMITEDILTEAAFSCRIDIFDLLLDAGADRHLKPYALTKPCYLNDRAMIVRILDTCPVDINLTFDTEYLAGMTILHDACYDSKVTIETVKLLLDRGADISTVSLLTGETTLHYAALGGKVDILNMLLDVDANRQLTPYALLRPCSQNNHAMIRRVLETCDIDINQAMDMPMMPRGFNLLHHACYESHVNSETVKLLLDHGADVRAVAENGDTVLHFAVRRCNCNKIRHLLAYNIPVNVKNSDNETPLVKLIGYLSWVLYDFPATAYRATFLAFKMLVNAGAKATPDFECKLNKLRIENPEKIIADYEVASIKSLQEMCRLIIRGSVPVPINASLEKLPVSKLLQEYLNFL